MSKEKNFEEGVKAARLAIMEMVDLHNRMEGKTVSPSEVEDLCARVEQKLDSIRASIKERTETAEAILRQKFQRARP